METPKSEKSLHDVSETSEMTQVAPQEPEALSELSEEKLKPNFRSTPSPMDITPVQSRGRESEEVLFSDSDVGSSHSLDLKHIKSYNSEPSSPGTPITFEIPSRSSSPRARRSSSKDGFSDTRSPETPRTPRNKDGETPKPKKRHRRKSTRSEISDKSARSKTEYVSSGYTSTPATGKIFRNLLLLEENLRQQVIQQRAMRRKYLTFLAILCSLSASIAHQLYFVEKTPTGTKRVILQFSLLALLVTLMLYHLSGEYQKTIVLPRRFLSSTNKGLRQFNIRLVKIKIPLSDSIIDLVREMSLFVVNLLLISFHRLNPAMIQNRDSKLEVFLVSCQSQCQPRIGITDVKLVLNARMFNTDIREGWELYRSEFWIHEGVRRRTSMMAFADEKKKKAGTESRADKKE
ncbi:hypothetical protein PGUG_00986 [Meyerozyma guilliermondii ATCC 6260]|uniref:Sporulation-specific protein SPO7 n=1 Tax=Meyerozyma guilliermondii (strain ATCC 6260 / CBS 566 / DSM 6381 / JCM 1539 / NBRC 10279 / NRRL Y-324) TaxID=294746 RepID=A5DCI1_PICGU|nr:uncharacterized protein PGUG_00986 [Meyerozyma guilliermondii ATCC 6260]EDK36888.2 hypothetical protein PGUG_00986 [Meyerozyma guilliermondii ATCC 6260]